MSSTPQLNPLPSIASVWSALGGPPLIGRGDERRGAAFWRDGKDFNVSINVAKGAWHDWVTGEGGGVIDLVEKAHDCDWREALGWLRRQFHIALSTGPLRVPADSAWTADLRMANWWSITAEAMAEEALAALPHWHWERRVYTDLLSSVRAGDHELVTEYRDWRRREPQLTAAMAHVGRLHDAGIQRRLAHWLRRLIDGTHSL